jgi:hypothetical protein
MSRARFFAAPSSPVQGRGCRPSNNAVSDMHLYDRPQIRCDACHRMVPFDPYVEIIGELALLDCPHCSGVRIDLALEQVLARN